MLLAGAEILLPKILFSQSEMLLVMLKNLRVILALKEVKL
jgi:hypothetical protein